MKPGLKMEYRDVAVGNKELRNLFDEKALFSISKFILDLIHIYLTILCSGQKLQESISYFSRNILKCNINRVGN